MKSELQFRHVFCFVLTHLLQRAKHSLSSFCLSVFAKLPPNFFQLFRQLQHCFNRERAFRFVICEAHPLLGLLEVVLHTDKLNVKYALCLVYFHSGNTSCLSRSIAMSQYFFSISIPIALRPSCFAAIRAVPVPQSGSQIVFPESNIIALLMILSGV